MQRFDRVLMTALVAGVWLSAAIQATTSTAAFAQTEQSRTQQENAPAVMPVTIHAKDIVGLSAFVQQTVRDHQPRAQSMPGLDQYVRSIVRNCRFSGSVRGDRLTSTNISC